jgi:uncharacterized protein
MTTLSVHATTKRERIEALDVLRGFALLGILVLNINDFAGPEATHDVPYGAFTGPHATINLVTFYIKWMFFEAKMRGLFSMLFGAGVTLLTRRLEERGAGAIAADIYLRRNMILVALGVMHYCLVWHGDILFDYGFVALLALYPLRKLSAKTLLVSGTALSAIVATWLGMVFVGSLHDIPLQQRAAVVAAHQRAGMKLTEEDEQIQKDWSKAVEDHQATPKSIEKQIKEAKVSYLQGVIDRSTEFKDSFFRVHIILMSDNLSAMLIGMGLMRMGFLTGELSFLTYALTALVGFAISLPLYAVGLAKNSREPPRLHRNRSMVVRSVLPVPRARHDCHRGLHSAAHQEWPAAHGAAARRRSRTDRADQLPCHPPPDAIPVRPGTVGSVRKARVLSAQLDRRSHVVVIPRAQHAMAALLRFRPG